MILVLCAVGRMQQSVRDIVKAFDGSTTPNMASG